MNCTTMQVCNLQHYHSCTICVLHHQVCNLQCVLHHQVCNLQHYHSCTMCVYCPCRCATIQTCLSVVTLCPLSLWPSPAPPSLASSTTSSTALTPSGAGTHACSGCNRLYMVDASNTIHMYNIYTSGNRQPVELPQFVERSGQVLRPTNLLVIICLRKKPAKVKDHSAQQTRVTDNSRVLFA